MFKKPATAFIVVLWILFVFPEVPLPLFNVKLLTFSLALPVFLIWLVTHLPRIPALIKITMNRYSYAFIFAAFSLWGVLVSSFSLNATSILYATYHSIFVVTSTLFIVEMFEAARTQPAVLQRAEKNIVRVGVVMAIGTIVSIFTGPIYKHQTLWTSRQWSDVLINSGVGFSSNPNQNAIYFSFYIFFLLFVVRPTNLKWFLTSALLGLALLTTLSRTGLACFILAMSILISIHCAKAFKTLQLPKWVFQTLVVGLLTFAFGTIYISFSGFFSADEGLLLGFSSDKVLRDLSERSTIWGSFINIFINSDLTQFLMGKGRRMSASIDYWGTWFTTHNAYLSILGEYGLIGLLTIVLLLLTVFFRITSRIMSSNRPHNVHQFCLLYLLAIAIASNAEEHLLSPINGFLIVFTLCKLHSVENTPKVKSP